MSHSVTDAHKRLVFFKVQCTTHVWLTIQSLLSAFLLLLKFENEVAFYQHHIAIMLARSKQKLI